MYIIGAYYVDSNGSHMAFWENRIGNDKEWHSATCNIRINNIPAPGGDIFVMLDSFASFATGRQIVFSTGNNACDYKRLTSAYKWTTEKRNPLPPEKEWFNVGKELVSHVIDWNGVIKSPNWKLSTIHSNLYQTRTDAGKGVMSVPYPSNFISIQGQIPDTIRDAIWALNVSRIILNKYLFF